MKKLFTIILMLALCMLVLTACGETNTDTTNDVVETVISNVTTYGGEAQVFANVKKIIASILDYNNIVENTDDRIEISYKDESYLKVEDLTYLMTILDETKNYTISSDAKDTKSLPKKVVITEESSNTDLIDQNSVSDTISYEENEVNS